MKALELYSAIFDSANNTVSEEEKNTIQYVKDYAEGALNESVSDKVAQLILDCHANFTSNGNGSNDFYHMVELKLEEVGLYD